MKEPRMHLKTSSLTSGGSRVPGVSKAGPTRSQEATQRQKGIKQGSQSHHRQTHHVRVSACASSCVAFKRVGCIVGSSASFPLELCDKCGKLFDGHEAKRVENGIDAPYYICPACVQKGYELRCMRDEGLSIRKAK